jgi:hypothetical protein
MAIRRQHHDFLDQRAAADGFRPDDPRQCVGEVLVGQRLLGDRRQRAVGVHLVAEFGLPCQQVSGRHQGEQLRRLVPSGCGREVLHLAHDLRQRGRGWGRPGRSSGVRHAVIVPSTARATNPTPH